jgi:DNA-binding NarL/FixJ family response regulator
MSGQRQDVGRRRVLIAEDHRGLRRAQAELLEVAGFEVVGRAADGADAVALARQVTPDLVLMDLSMPVLNGLEATRLLTELLPGTPVVILTAYDSPDLHRAVREAGAAGYLVKDVGVDELVAALDRILTGWPARPDA